MPRGHGSQTYLFWVPTLLGGQRTSKPGRKVRDHGIGWITWNNNMGTQTALLEEQTWSPQNEEGNID